MAVVILGLTILLFGFQGDGRSQGREPTKRTNRLDDHLVRIAVKLYDLNAEIPVLYAKTFGKQVREAGEGLFSKLFNDPIVVLELAIEQNEKNLLARYYLGKSYYAKSFEGEGNWSRSLLLKAEQEFSLVISEASRQKASREVLTDSKRALEDVRKILQGMGSAR